MGRLGAILEASGAVLEASKTEKANLLKMSVFQWECCDFCLMELSWGSPRAPLEPSGGVFEACVAVWGASWAAAGQFGVVLGPPWAAWGLF